jgi:ABC-2 type transport system permease protein
MKRVFLMALKDLKLLSRDKVGLFFMLIFPIIMGVFFGFVMGGSSGSKTTKMKIAVVDEDQSPMSEKFVAALKKIDSLDVQSAEREDAQNRVRKGSLLAMVALPNGFGETAGVMWADPPQLELGLDPSRTAESAMLEGMVMQSMGDLISARFQDPATMRGFIDDAKENIANDESMSPIMRPLLSSMMSSFDSVFDTMEQVQNTEAEGGGANQGPFSNGMQLANISRIDVTRKVIKGSKEDLASKVNSKWDISFPQSMVWGILGCVAGFATLTVRERTLGTLTRLQVAPVPRWQILAGKGVGCFLAVIGVIVLMMTIGTVLGMRPRNWPLLGLATVCTAFCFVGIMMLLSLFGKTEQATSGAAWGALTVMAMFGGGMIPVAFMPGFMEKFSHYDPVKWAVVSIEGAIWRGYSFQEMLKPCGILVAVGIVSLSIGCVVISKRES